MGPQRMYGLTPWVRRLLVANLLVFLQRPWTFLTYMFLHAGPLHLAFNLLALFIFGAPVEERLGSRSFVGFYFLCGLGGAALSFLLMMLVPMARPIVGASGAIYGLMLAFAWYWPDAPIFVFPFPVPIPAKWLATFPGMGTGKGKKNIGASGQYQAHASISP